MKIKYEEYDMDMLEIIYQWYQCAIKTNRPIPEKIMKLVSYYKELKGED